MLNGSTAREGAPGAHAAGAKSSGATPLAAGGLRMMTVALAALLGSVTSGVLASPPLISDAVAATEHASKFVTAALVAALCAAGVEVVTRVGPRLRASNTCS